MYLLPARCNGFAAAREQQKISFYYKINNIKSPVVHVVVVEQLSVWKMRHSDVRAFWMWDDKQNINPYKI